MSHSNIPNGNHPMSAPPPMPVVPQPMSQPHAKPQSQNPFPPSSTAEHPSTVLRRPGTAPANPPVKERRLFSRNPSASNQDPMERSETKIGRATAKRSTLLVIVFLLFFLSISFLSNHRLGNAKSAIEANNAKVSVASDSRQISERIAVQVRWIDTALSMGGSARDVVTNASKGPNVTHTAMLDANGNALASSPGARAAFENVSIKNFPKSGIRLTSVLSEGGVANPVIIRKLSDVYLLTMLAPNSLIGLQSQGQNGALIDPGQRIIDASGTIARDGLGLSFNLNRVQLSNLDNLVAEGLIRNANTITATSAVPNTDLKYVKRDVSSTLSLPYSWLPFALLFLSTAAVLLTLLRNALKHMKALRNTEKQTLVSKERFRVAVESGRGGVWEIDLKNNSVYLSSSLSRVLGLEPKDQTLAVSQFLSLFHAADRDRLLSTARRAHLQGEFDIEARVAHLPLVLQCRGQTSQRGDTEGHMVIVGVAMDVTEQRGAQSRLQMAENRLFDALNSMTDSFVIWDRLGRLVLWNGKFEDFFGFAPGELQIGMENHIVEHRGGAAIADVYETDEAEGNIEIRLNDGRWIRYNESPTADGGQVSIGTDITEIRAREQDLRENDIALRNTVNVLKKSQVRIMELAENYEQEKIRAEDANQSKSDFLANMSHELRTPLNAINGFSDIMKKEMFGPLGDPRYKEYVSDILFSGQHLLSLINDILDMSKIEAGKMTLNTDILQINEMISQVVRIVRGRAEDGRLKLIYDNIDIKTIEADPRAVKQVLLNLATNAIKFTPEGGTVRIEAIEKQAGIIVKVHDSGIGISKENIERLAKPFEQIESQNSKQHEGTGLGLALSKSLVELHGGNFLMESEPGQGTVVTFTLPNVPPVQKAAADENEVANEITRLAQDIAQVLDQNEQAPLPAAPSMQPADQETNAA